MEYDVMDQKKELEIITTRTVFLKEGQLSDNIVLSDNAGDGDMFFRFRLKYVKEENTKTIFEINDAHRANITIETRPEATTTLIHPQKIGTYAHKRNLLLNFIVQPCDANNVHSVNITFYTEQIKNTWH